MNKLMENEQVRYYAACFGIFFGSFLLFQKLFRSKRPLASVACFLLLLALLTGTVQKMALEKDSIYKELGIPRSSQNNQIKSHF